MGAPWGSRGGESGNVATVSLAQIGHHRSVDRDAAEIMQQHAAMSRRVGADAVKAEQVIVLQPLGPAVADGVIAPSSSICRVAAVNVRARNPSFPRTRSRSSP